MSWLGRHKDVVTGGGAIGLALLLFFASFDVKDFAATGVGAAFLPRVAAGLFALLGTLLILADRRKSRLDSAPAQPAQPAAPSAPGAGPGGDPKFGGAAAVLASLLLMGVYVALLSRVGFILTTAGYIFLQVLILTAAPRRRLLLFAVVASVTAVSTYFLFVRVFQVMIPPGILG